MTGFILGHSELRMSSTILDCLVGSWKYGPRSAGNVDGSQKSGCHLRRPVRRHSGLLGDNHETAVRPPAVHSLSLHGGACPSCCCPSLLSN